MANATVRVRPLRLAFLVEPNDKRGLQRIFETNSALWGGLFNFIIPLFKGVPKRYREEHFRTVPAAEMVKGLRRQGRICPRGLYAGQHARAVRFHCKDISWDANRERGVHGKAQEEGRQDGVAGAEYPVNKVLVLKPALTA